MERWRRNHDAMSLVTQAARMKYPTESDHHGRVLLALRLLYEEASYVGVAEPAGRHLSELSELITKPLLEAESVVSLGSDVPPLYGDDEHPWQDKWEGVPLPDGLATAPAAGEPGE
jgi:hypothetical protein